MRFLSSDQSMTPGAVSALCRKAATKVPDFQWACGTLLTKPFAAGARPRCRAMLVEVPVSSMKASRSALSSL